MFCNPKWNEEYIGFTIEYISMQNTVNNNVGYYHIVRIWF